MDRLRRCFALGPADVLDDRCDNSITKSPMRDFGPMDLSISPVDLARAVSNMSRKHERGKIRYPEFSALRINWPLRSSNKNQ